MGLDIFFLEDIRNAILAANEASSATAEAATSSSTPRSFNFAQDRLCSGQAGLTTSQNARILDLIAERLRGELSKDSQALLDALHEAAVGNVDVMRHYRQGYKAALTTVALAFGLSPAIITSHQGEVLEVEARAVSETLPAR